MMKRSILSILVLAFCLSTPISAVTIEWVSDYYDQDVDSIVDDGGWMDLLRAQGYTVNVRTSSINTNYWRNGTTNIALTDEMLGYLNAADLVIISRTTDSTNYANGDTERNSWNGITKPMILMGAAIAQNNRLRWLNNATQTYLRGTTTLEAVVPTHPIFAGVTLDSSNQVQIIDPAKGYRAEAPTNALTVLATTSAGNGTVIARTADPNQYVWIAEWAPGTAFYSGTTANTTGGKRLLFAAGTRERSTAGSEIGRGVYNLNAVGEKMFLNAVNYMIPEPATIAMLGLGGLALVRSRKRA